MRKIILFLTALLFCGKLFAAGISEIVFFGDSLTDNGNLYSLLKVVPKSPPYYNGRFTNGPTWAETLGDHYRDKLSIPYSIYAYGGATVLLHSPTDKFFAPITLEGELLQYYSNSLFSDKSTTLYIIWIGANDYLMDDQTDIDLLTTQVVDKITWAITSLTGQGAQHFLILNLPDLAKAPFAVINNDTEHLHAVGTMHNQKLAKAIQSLNESNPSLKVISLDIYDIFNDLVTNTEKYNQKYQANISVVNKACWEGGLTYKPKQAKLSSDLNRELQKIFTNKSKGLGNNFNSQSMTDHILRSPGLREAYLKGKMQEDGITPCANPDQYVFWDLIHPSEVVHKMLSAIAMETLENQAKDLFIG